MRNVSFVLGALLALHATAAPQAAPSDRLSPLTDSQRGALHHMLAKPGNAGMEVRLKPRDGIPALVLRGAKPLAHATMSEQEPREAVRYLATHAKLFRLNDAQRELVLHETRRDSRGGRHYRYQQHVDGVPIRGAQVAAHFNAAGEMYALNTAVVPTPADIDVNAVISAVDAAGIARQRISGDVEQEPTLEVRGFDDGWRLVYAVSSMEGMKRWMTVVDAHSGEVLQHFLDHHEYSVSASGADLGGDIRAFTAWRQDGIFHLVDTTIPVSGGYEKPMADDRSWGDTLVVDVQHTEGDSWRRITSASAHSGWDAAGVSALANSQVAYRYFRDTHGRMSIDDRNGSLMSAVHYGTDYDNAFWNGKWMVYGDGGRRFGNLAECVDIVAHEMTHGVIDHTADLVYENQSGALNESLADVFGVLAANDGNWVVGEGCVKLRPGYLRSLENPHGSLGWQPAHMSQYVERPNTKDGDWGGVHANSGIPNRAAYLLMEGLSVEGLGESIGREKGGQLYYHALQNYLLPDSDFLDLRRALLLSANDLFPGSGTERAAIALAFDAVGIVEGDDAETREAGSGKLTASQARLDFGDVPVGKTESLTLTLSNESASDVAILGAVLDSSVFSHNAGEAVLAPGESVEVAIVFSASADAGSHAAALEITTDGEVASIVVDLVATAVQPPSSTSSQGSKRNGASSGGGPLHPLMLLLPFALGRRSRR